MSKWPFVFARTTQRRYVESHEHAIRQKADIMVDHFHEQVLARRKIGGEARAMVVTSGIELAIQYFHAFEEHLKERRRPYRAIVAFSGEHDWGRRKVTEASLNGFPSALIPERFIQDSYRFLIVTDKFQTGYDEPLLHTMYVDKPLSGIKAVQTLSRLNRAHPQKHDTFVLDFLNDMNTITEAFADYYRTTLLSQETDPNKLHDLKADLDSYQVCADIQVDDLVARYLSGAERDLLDPILDACVATYKDDLDEDGQVDFKGKEEDLSRGIMESIDMDSYRVEVRSALQIALPDAEAELEPVRTGGGGRAEAELDRLSNIIKTFNDQFGNIEWRDADKIRQVIGEEIPAKVAADTAYQNAKQHSDKQNARIEHDRALQDVVTALLADHTELFKQFMDNPSFRKWLQETIFAATYNDA